MSNPFQFEKGIDVIEPTPEHLGEIAQSGTHAEQEVIELCGLNSPIRYSSQAQNFASSALTRNELAIRYPHAYTQDEVAEEKGIQQIGSLIDSARDFRETGIRKRNPQLIRGAIIGFKLTQEEITSRSESTRGGWLPKIVAERMSAIPHGHMSIAYTWLNQLESVTKDHHASTEAQQMMDISVKTAFLPGYMESLRHIERAARNERLGIGLMLGSALEALNLVQLTGRTGPTSDEAWFWNGVVTAMLAARAQGACIDSKEILSYHQEATKISIAARDPGAKARYLGSVFKNSRDFLLLLIRRKNIALEA